MKRALCAILLVAMLMVVAAEKSFAGADPFIGEITIFAGKFAPAGYAFCEGQMLQVSQNTALFALLGTTYGGDGRTSFALPNLQEAEKALHGARYIIAVQGIFPSRQ